jgi:hypothetical protein
VTVAENAFTNKLAIFAQIEIIVAATTSANWIAANGVPSDCRPYCSALPTPQATVRRSRATPDGGKSRRPTYAFIIAEKINRSIVALVGGSLMIVVGVLTQQRPLRASTSTPLVS